VAALVLAPHLESLTTHTTTQIGPSFGGCRNDAKCVHVLGQTRTYVQYFASVGAVLQFFSCGLRHTH